MDHTSRRRRLVQNRRTGKISVQRSGSNLKDAQTNSPALSDLIAALTEVEPLITPTIISEQIPPGTAIALLADGVYLLQTGNEQETPNELRSLLCEMILLAWQQGRFTPSSEFPYTLEQVIKDATNSQGSHEPDPPDG